MQPAVHGHEPQRHSSMRRLTILTIDDTPAVVEIFAKGLEMNGQRVLTALSGRRGIELFQEHMVDAVLCDLNMPGMDGWAVGRAVRETCLRNGKPKPPFVLVTGSADLITEDKMEDAGVDAVVAKPADVLRLLEVITRIRAGNRPVSHS